MIKIFWLLVAAVALTKLGIIAITIGPQIPEHWQYLGYFLAGLLQLMFFGVIVVLLGLVSILGASLLPLFYKKK